jgi:transcriptional regulator with XRE-family HTH domain
MPQKNLLSPTACRPTDIGERVRTRRKELGYTQAKVALDAKIGKRTLQRIEAGAPPAADTVWRLELFLELPAGSLVPGWKLDGSLHSKSVGARIRERRRALKLSLVQLAWDSGKSAAALSRFERGVPYVAEAWDPFINWDLIVALRFISRERFHDWIEYGEDEQAKWR